MNKILFVDCETLGFGAAPRIIALSWILTDINGTELKKGSYLVKPDGWEIDPESFAGKNGYTTAHNMQEGIWISIVLNFFCVDVKNADLIVAHNAPFDKRAIQGELSLLGFIIDPILDPIQKPWHCTMKYGKEYCMLPGKNGIKAPKLTELYEHLFFKPMMDAHNADTDVKACKDCFFEMVRLRAIVLMPAATTVNEDSI